MTLFWLLVGVMILVALAFVLVPILRRHISTHPSRDELNVRIIQHQLNELDADLANGKLAESEYAAARQDLERELLADVSSRDTGPRAPRTGGGDRWIVGLVAIALPVTAVTLYYSLGASELVVQPRADAQAGVNTSQDPQHAIEEMVTKLAERLRVQPDDVKGWQMLGRSYTFMRRFSDAVGAYANAYRLVGDSDPELLVDYADAVATANGGRLAGMPRELVEKALAVDPENVKGLWLMGQAHYQDGNLAEAVGFFERVAARLPAGSENAQIVAQQIRNVRTQLADGGAATPPEATPTTVPPSAAPVAVTVQVAVDPSLQQEVSPEDTLFVFARAVKGPRMPLAIVRAQAKELPITVTLDDSSAMAPTLKLSNFSDVTIGARISKSGEAMPQSGDLTGTVPSVKPAVGEVVQVTISEKIP